MDCGGALKMGNGYGTDGRETRAGQYEKQSRMKGRGTF